jgi:hypothetical protein
MRPHTPSAKRFAFWNHNHAELRAHKCWMCAARVATASESLSLAWSSATMVDMGLAAASAAKSLPSLPFFHLGPGKSIS